MSHPTDDDLTLDPLPDTVVHHLPECPRCRIRRKLLLVDPLDDETSSVPDARPKWIDDLAAPPRESTWDSPIVGVTLDGSVLEGRTEQIVIIGAVTEPEALQARFDRCARVSIPGLVAWSDLQCRSDGTWVATRRHCAGRPMSEALADNPGALVRWTLGVAMTLAELHESGLAHGGLVTEPILIVDDRTVLPPPVLTIHPDPAADWQAFGRRVWECLEVAPTPEYAAVAGQLADGSLTGTMALIRWFELTERHRISTRYTRIEVIGKGGMGEVHRVYDHALERVVALKVLRADKDRPDRRARFESEVKVTARLQHPGIVALHDVGEMYDGTPFYTMEEVKGESLQRTITEVHDAAANSPWHATASGWSLRRLIEVFARVCDAVGYAHSRGVVHRDLKPANVMLGDHGEVRVVDWGLVRIDRQGDEFITFDDDDLHTRDGAVFGTANYMPPEQAEGHIDLIDTRADVYSLGAMLYEILCGKPPYQLKNRKAVLQAVLSGPPTDVTRVTTLTLPDDLVSVVRQCMTRSRDDRPGGAGEVTQLVRAWLEGQRRRDHADEAIAAVIDHADHSMALRRQAQSIRVQGANLLGNIDSWAPLEAKRPAWVLQDRADQLEHQAAELEAGYEQGIRAALDHLPDHEGALERLADLYKRRLVDAEVRRDTAAATRFRTMLEGHDNGRYRGWADGTGRLTLHTDPAGAAVYLSTWHERDRVLRAGPENFLGTTPLEYVEVPRGSHRLRLSHARCHDVVYPVQIERAGHWNGTPPGDDSPHPITLPPLGTIEAGECFVAEGWFVAGGDPEATEAIDRRRLWVDSFVAREHPVTFGEYLVFLNDIAQRGDATTTRAFTPTALEANTPAVLVQAEDGLFRLGSHRTGDPLHPDDPVLLVTWDAACAYAAWWSTRTGKSWRLPHDHEWEKAARGVDGRRFPWGDRLDPTFACMLRSHAAAPRTCQVSAYPTDCGPYGLRGAAGNVRECCANGYERRGPVGDRIDPTSEAGDPRYRMVRGGSFKSVESYCLLAGRFVLRPGERATVIGFRLVRTPDPITD